MQQMSDIGKTLAGMPAPALVTLVILAAFALSDYTIVTVVNISKGRR